MAKQASISHVVNGYSRYDVPESKAFSCTPGILYPVRIDFINARDRVSIEQGIDVRSNPFAVPSFNPYTVRLHRFWVPLQLYHPEMRTNSSKFDMNDLSLNWLPNKAVETGSPAGPSLGSTYGFSNSLMAWLRIAGRDIYYGTYSGFDSTELPDSAHIGQWANADTYLAYWDIVRNYYSYSQWGLYSLAWPGSWTVFNSVASNNSPSWSFLYRDTAAYFSQDYCNLEFLDAYYESQFYPAAVASSNGTYNRSNLFSQIIGSSLRSIGASNSDGYPVSSYYPKSSSSINLPPEGQFSTKGSSDADLRQLSLFVQAHPMAVVPSNPDRYSRLIPYGDSSAVSMDGVSTIPQLAIAARLQEYKDLLGAGGSRYSDWLETFFASKIEHVDRPKLLFAASQTVNVQVIMNQAGWNNQTSTSGLLAPLGAQGGAVAFNERLGRRQSYYFAEPGYMIDMLSIRPVYYWAGVTPDYLNYKGSDYFNPLYNDVGFQDVPAYNLVGDRISTVAQQVLGNEPCFNEFRSSYDEVLGQISVFSGSTSVPGSADSKPLYSFWVQQRSLDFAFLSAGASTTTYYPALFVDMQQVNSCFESKVEDNFFVNMSYSVQKKNLVNKTFATRLCNR